jgi:hypothetical protein
MDHTFLKSETLHDNTVTFKGKLFSVHVNNDKRIILNIFQSGGQLREIQCRKVEENVSILKNLRHGDEISATGILSLQNGVEMLIDAEVHISDSNILQIPSMSLDSSSLDLKSRHIMDILLFRKKLEHLGYVESFSSPKDLLAESMYDPTIRVESCHFRLKEMLAGGIEKVYSLGCDSQSTVVVEMAQTQQTLQDCVHLARSIVEEVLHVGSNVTVVSFLDALQTCLDTKFEENSKLDSLIKYFSSHMDFKVEKNVIEEMLRIILKKFPTSVILTSLPRSISYVYKRVTFDSDFTESFIFFHDGMKICSGGVGINDPIQWKEGVKEYVTKSHELLGSLLYFGLPAYSSIRFVI